MAAAQAAANHGDERQSKYKPWRCKTNTRVRRKKERNPTEQDCESHSQEFEQESWPSG